MATESDELSVGTIALVGLFVILITIIIIVGMQALVARSDRQAELAAEAKLRPTVLTDQVERIASYRHLDKEKGVVAVPIERAMELVVRELSAKEAGN